LRSGLAPGLALQAAGRSAGAARGIAQRMLAAAAADALGGNPAEVFKGDAEPGSAAAAVGAAWAVCQQTGARLAAPVARIAQGAAADLRIARETDAALAGARSSAHLLAALPIAGVVLGAISGTNSVHVLLSTSVGQLCLLLGVALDLAGLAWLDRLAAAGHA
jgi:tight adherence protein B